MRSLQKTWAFAPEAPEGLDPLPRVKVNSLVRLELLNGCRILRRSSAKHTSLSHTIEERFGATVPYSPLFYFIIIYFIPFLLLSLAVKKS